MNTDRDAIVKAISQMLDHPDSSGIYPTSTCYSELEIAMSAARVETLGWAWAAACALLDAGKDPRLEEVPGVLARMTKDLGQ